MKYTIGSNYSAAGQVTEIPDKWLQEAKIETGSIKGAIDQWLLEQGYITDSEYAEEQKRQTPSEKPAARTRKPDEVKRALIASLYAHLLTLPDLSNIDVVNAERVIRFSLGDNDYDVTLARKRKK